MSDYLAIGVDFSTDWRKTWIAELRSGSGVPTMSLRVEGDAGDQVLVDSLLEAARSVPVPENVRIGVDAPFGWPDDFVNALMAHQGEDQPRGLWKFEVRNTLQYRCTDRFLGGRSATQPNDQAGAEPKITPLSVSTDHLGSTAMRCAHVQSLWEQAGGPPVDRSGRGGPLTEVYPAAALRYWEMHPKTYKDPKHTKPRETLFDELARDAQWLEPCRDACVKTDDALDAVVASLVAGCLLHKATAFPSHVDFAELGREGWIHLPTLPLADLKKVLLGKD